MYRKTGSFVFLLIVAILFFYGFEIVTGKNLIGEFGNKKVLADTVTGNSAGTAGGDFGNYKNTWNMSADWIWYVDICVNNVVKKNYSMNYLLNQRYGGRSVGESRGKDYIVNYDVMWNWLNAGNGDAASWFDSTVTYDIKMYVEIRPVYYYTKSRYDDNKGLYLYDTSSDSRVDMLSYSGKRVWSSKEMSLPEMGDYIKAYIRNVLGQNPEVAPWACSTNFYKSNWFCGRPYDGLMKPQGTTISFDANGGGWGKQKVLKVSVRNNIASSPGEPERNGYLFTGFSSKADGSGEKWLSGQEKTILSSTPQTWYAIWKKTNTTPTPTVAGAKPSADAPSLTSTPTPTTTIVYEYCTATDIYTCSGNYVRTEGCDGHLSYQSGPYEVTQIINAHNTTIYCDGYCNQFNSPEPHLHYRECACMTAFGCCNYLPYVCYDKNFAQGSAVISPQSVPYDYVTKTWYPIQMANNIWTCNGCYFDTWSLVRTRYYSAQTNSHMNTFEKLGAKAPGNSSGDLQLSSTYTAFAQWIPNDYILYFDYNSEHCIYPEELVKDNDFLLVEKVSVFDAVTGVFLRSTNTHLSPLKVITVAGDRDCKKVTYKNFNFNNNYDLTDHYNLRDASGSTVLSTIKDNYGDDKGTYGRLPIPSMRGYKFAGWSYSESLATKPVLTYDEYFVLDNRQYYYAESDGTVLQNENGTQGNTVNVTDYYIVSGDSTIYARWEPINYNISFDYNIDWKRDSVNSSAYYVGVNSIVLSYGGFYSALPVPYKQGYIFMGWYLDEYEEQVRQVDGTYVNRTNGYCKKCGYACEEHRIKEGVSLVALSENHTLYASWKQKEMYLVETDAKTGETLDTRIIRIDDFYGDYYTYNPVKTKNKLYITWLNNYMNGGRLQDSRFHQVINGEDIYYDNQDAIAYKGKMLEGKNNEDYGLTGIGNNCLYYPCSGTDSFAHNSYYNFVGWSFDITGLIDNKYLALNGNKMNSAGVIVQDSINQGYDDREIFQIREAQSSIIQLDYCLKFYHGFQYEREQWDSFWPVFMYDLSGNLLTGIVVKQEETYGNLPSPDREGYKFIGWSTEKIECSNEVGACEGDISENCATGLFYNGDINHIVDSSSTVDFGKISLATLYAVWQPKEVVVNLDYELDYKSIDDNIQY